jgi:signal peptidase I
VGEEALHDPAAAARSRFRALAVLVCLGLVAIVGIGLRAAGKIPSVHAYYIPSESMMPTLVKNDRILAATGVDGPFTRGEVLLFRTARGDTYIQRLAGLPGDRIAVAGGKVILNGKAVRQQPLGTVTNGCMLTTPPGPAQWFREQFPGEAGPHEIYDCGPSVADDFPEQIVAPGHLFLLGDNRDNTADSRVARNEGGVSQVAVSDVTGRAPIYTFASGRRFGQSVH